ncbi:hypothetical protein BD311DRAFT_308856 [Dichomitus squalens]|uniref:Uncharacterized protein n=1 Tax=Dichomitus squalens TaxID=114155 RepID=A0A4Q9MS40_9APHY|nr:hypothetical protein BD311DRAFT_308856 [Dichomitus squalens]
MPSTSADVTRSSSSPSRASLHAPTPVFTTVEVPASPSFVTTTVTSAGSASLPTVGSVSNATTSDIPIAAIAGGTAAGVVLALVAVIGWTWWGRCIKRRTAKERKEVLAFLEIRENTRRNASTLSHPVSQYRPSLPLHGSHERKVTFVSNQSTLRSTTELKKEASDPEKPTPNPSPRPPAPIAHLNGTPTRPEAGHPPPLPRRNPQRARAVGEPLAASDQLPPTQHRLMHQASTLSSGSVYSTQSAMEEGQSGVPSSLLMALGNEGNRRSLLAGYMPWNRYRSSVASNNRLSEYSTGSGYSQLDDLPWESVGFAYGEENELPR